MQSFDKAEVLILVGIPELILIEECEDMELQVLGQLGQPHLAPTIPAAHRHTPHNTTHTPHSTHTLYTTYTTHHTHTHRHNTHTPCLLKTRVFAGAAVPAQAHQGLVGLPREVPLVRLALDHPAVMQHDQQCGRGR